MDTEATLNDALIGHLRDEGAIGDDDVIVAWASAYVALTPDDDTRQGSVWPAAQPNYVTHGLAAGLMAVLNAGMGDGGCEEEGG